MNLHKCKEVEPEYWFLNEKTSLGEPIFQQYNKIEIKGMGFWCERENRSGVKSDDTTFLVGVLCLLASWIAINNQISFTEKVLPMCM